MRVAVLGAEAALRERPQADEVIVIDPSPAALERAYTEAADPAWSFVLGDGSLLPLPDASLDELHGDADEAERRRVVRPPA